MGRNSVVHRKKRLVSPKTAIQVTDEEMAIYRATARHREEQERQEQERRAREAWEVAQRAAVLLKSRFDVQRVILFGSLARRDRFHQRSDIDLAVEGIEGRDFWRAWSALDTLGREWEIDLVDVETAPLSLRSEIEREGVEL